MIINLVFITDNNKEQLSLNYIIREIDGVKYEVKDKANGNNVSRN